MPDELVEVYPGYVKIGKPMVFPLYSHSGVLLVEKGTLMTEEQYVLVMRQKKVLTQQSALHSAITELKLFSYSTGGSAGAYKFPATIERILKLESAYLELVIGGGDGFAEKIETIVEKLYSIATGNNNSSLAKIFLRTTRYAVVEVGFAVAIMGALFTAHLGWKPRERATFMAAALTADLGVLVQENQQNIFNITPSITEITDPSHSESSAQLLKERKIENEKWLYYVKKHHAKRGAVADDRADKKVSEMALSLMQFLVEYCHLIFGYGCDSFFYPDIALSSLVSGERGGYHQYFVKLMNKIVGIYPPGSMVKLVSGEIALVQRPGNVPERPHVAIIADAKGKSLPQFIVMQVDGGKRAIRDMCFESALLRQRDYSRFWN